MAFCPNPYVVGTGVAKGAAEDAAARKAVAREMLGRYIVADFYLVFDRLCFCKFS